MAGRRRMGVMLQVSNVPETLTVREHVHLFSAYYPAPLPLPDVLALAGLESVKDRRYGKLSGGQQQRVLFALAICGNPDLLFLDEPTAGMDVESRRHFWHDVRELASSGRADPADDALPRGGRCPRGARRRAQPRPHHRRRPSGRHQGRRGRSPGDLPHAACPPTCCGRCRA